MPTDPCSPVAFKWLRPLLASVFTGYGFMLRVLASIYKAQDALTALACCLAVSAHVSMQIPTKIEVFVGFANGSPAGAAEAAAGSSSMRRLGYLSFDSNERSNHQARELKSVHVTVEAELVRLVIHRCHVNKLNIYNQV